MKITSVQNETVKRLSKLHQKKYRDEYQQVLLEGEHLHQEVVDAGIPHTTYGTHGDVDVEITQIIADKLSTTKSGSQLFTLIEKPKSMLPLNGNRYLLVDNIQDPGNLGTMIRTAYSFGFDAVIISDNSVDEFNDKCVRATQGSIFHIPCIRTDLLDAIKMLQENGVVVYATHLSDDTTSLEEVRDNRVAVIMGNEGQGVSQDVIVSSNHTLKIETSRFESLNVAIATAIICYQLRK